VEDRALYARLLGVKPPWKVVSINLREDVMEVDVVIEHDGTGLTCPQCGAAAAAYDMRKRTWRHLDSCEAKTFVTAAVPRVRCDEHGIKQIDVPWSEPRGRFTLRFEELAIAWLREVSISAVARLMRITWDEANGIMARAVTRGLARREERDVAVIGIDETSFQKRHEYVTVVCDVANGTVLHVADGRTTAALSGFFATLSESQRDAIEAVSMDMSHLYINSVRACIPDATSKICFDRFHVASLINEAVNKVRRREHNIRRRQGDPTLRGTKHLWLMGPERRRALSDERQIEFKELLHSVRVVARAWTFKEAARDLWDYSSPYWAERAWKKWIASGLRCRLAPVRHAASTVQKYLWGIVNAVTKGVTNGMSESINSKIQWIKRTACGFRNRDRFRAAIFFHCGGLDMSPGRAHTLS
jgi:transposase